jgi:hypothetical protein
MDQPAPTHERGTLASETRQTAMLLGGALVSIGALLMLLVLLTHWLAA